MEIEKKNEIQEKIWFLKVWGNLNEILSDQHFFYYETFPLTETLKL